MSKSASSKNMPSYGALVFAIVVGLGGVAAALSAQGNAGPPNFSPSADISWINDVRTESLPALESPHLLVFSIELCAKDWPTC